MNRLLGLLGIMLLVGCDIEWWPDLAHQAVCVGTDQQSQVSVGNAFEAWNQEEHDLVFWLSRRNGNDQPEHIAGPVWVAAGLEPQDPEDDGVNWATIIDPGVRNDAGPVTFTLTWGWTDAGTTSPVYELEVQSHTITLSGC